MWHASVAFIGPLGPVPCEQWTAAIERALESQARRLLRGVGAGRDEWERGDIAIHLRRRVSPAEFDWQATDERSI